jgi:serine/threonine-protein kinase RsbW
MASPKKLTIPGRFDRIREACDFVIEGAEEAGFDPDEVFRIQLACDEACTNIIEHAYGAEDVGEIRISWEIKKGALLFNCAITAVLFGRKQCRLPRFPIPWII